MDPRNKATNRVKLQTFPVGVALLQKSPCNAIMSCDFKRCHSLFRAYGLPVVFSNLLATCSS